MANTSKLDQEMIDGFKEECHQILEELTKIVETLEEEPGSFALLADFSQKIDRIMGAAKTMALFDADHTALTRIGKIAEICKFSGYKVSEKKDASVVPILVSFFADVVDSFSELVEVIEDVEKSKSIANAFSKTIQTRLAWLAEKIDPQLAHFKLEEK